MKSIEEISKIASLAKLSLDGEDMDALLADMAGYMAMADQVRDADISALDCTFERELAPMREDVLIPSYPAEVLLNNTGTTQDGHYVMNTGGGRAR